MQIIVDQRYKRKREILVFRKGTRRAHPIKTDENDNKLDRQQAAKPNPQHRYFPQ